jgi:hypothetical protein
VLKNNLPVFNNFISGNQAGSGNVSDNLHSNQVYIKDSEAGGRDS